jgi:hypothetical protein
VGRIEAGHCRLQPGTLLSVECRQGSVKIGPVLGVKVPRLVQQGDLGRQDRQAAGRADERLVQAERHGLVAAKTEEPVVDLVEQKVEEVGLG